MGLQTAFQLEVFMNRTYIVANSLIWAAAIIASAQLGAPTMLTLVLLPSLATMSWLAALPAAAKRSGGQ